MPTIRDPFDRWTEKVDKAGPVPEHAPHLGPCWIWTGAMYRKGYGAFMYRKGVVNMAHRWSYEHFVGPIPEGLHIDHLCRVRCCVNPAHLEPVTHFENHQRGTFATATHCRNGHEYTPDNIYIRPSRPTHRACRACQRATQAARRGL